ncbi:MAG: hypothetical protein R3A49_07400 [Acidimicrobiia bacterium]
MNEPTLVVKVLAIHNELDTAGVGHAFGGALALAYYVEDVRATKDVDVNIFAPPADVESVFAALPEGVARNPADTEAVRRDGQIRLWWGHTPVDLFFDIDEIHQQASAHARIVPFAETTIPVLGSTELTVFKLMYSRPKDWVDIASMVHAGSVDTEAVSTAFARIMGPEHEALTRLDELVGRTPRPGNRPEPTFRELRDNGPDARGHERPD